VTFSLEELPEFQCSW